MNSNWADKLIVEYEIGKQSLKEVKDNLGNSQIDAQDKTKINSMVRDMEFSVEWMKTGRQPGAYRGADKKSIYQVRYFEDMDMIPDIAEQLEEEKEELYISREEKKILSEIFTSLSPRERLCYILHVGQGQSMGSIAQEIGLSKSSVQKYIDRAKDKVKEKTQ